MATKGGSNGGDLEARKQFTSPFPHPETTNFKVLGVQGVAWAQDEFGETPRVPGEFEPLDPTFDQRQGPSCQSMSYLDNLDMIVSHV